jgi:hypothetical protein
MGYTKRFTVERSYDGKQNPYHYIDFIYKDGAKTFGFFWFGYGELIEIMQVMRDKGHLNDAVNKALLTLDMTKLYNAIIKRLKSVMDKPDLSLDWKTEMKWVDKPAKKSVI